MIEINLLPGAGRKPAKRAKAKRGGGGGGGLKLPKLSLGGGKLPSLDRMLAFVVGAWIGAPLLLAWLILGTRNEKADLGLAIEQAQQDSARYAEMIARVTRLQARRDTIAQKIEVINQIDGGRYIWPHLLDEISRALPAYTWLVGLQTSGEGSGPSFLLTGRTANNFALTEFLVQLENSPFIRNVTLISTEQAIEAESIVYAFTVQASYEQPPADVVETVPLFVGEQTDGIASE